ncbi:MAG: SynChlorMet cassette protein ScmC [Bacteroidetes bacterium]|nr:SynChlorMet cassette protein ScmC [Bacteroidota bacterium]
MTQTTLHKISFQLKNDVEVLFQGDDRVLHVLNDYKDIFSLNKLPAISPADRFTITLIDQSNYDKDYNLTDYHFRLMRHKAIEIIYDFSNQNSDDYACMLMMFSMLLGTVAQYSGGGLMHAALGELNGKGFLMAAPGGTGKSTASSRLLAPFISHCDDTTLVVKDKEGKFWAHPFPTWSRFYWGGSGGNWNFDHVVPLNSIFYLSQSETDSLTTLNTAEKVACCVAAFEQASRMLARKVINKDKINSKKSESDKPKRNPKDWFAIGNDPDQEACREIRKQWFENTLIMSRQLQADKLNLSLTGNFWELIEKSL